MGYTCEGCGQQLTGRRVVFTTEASDERGVDVDVAKRWVVCPDCGSDVFARLGMASPWADADARTLHAPGDDAMMAASPGFGR